ncbi:MAG: GTP cyclohydrolase I FolE2 [Candidatus Caenarcaniphilales bacterium]|nr:GTP cyclohydrolase I FolE2 [Candidatus Caenarcaniphilales bacterium]
MKTEKLLNEDNNQKQEKSFPDIAIETKALVSGSLDKVGMEEVELVIKLKSEDDSIISLPATANLFVSLDAPNKKGIHMSRLLLKAHKILDNEILTYESLEKLIRSLKESHNDMSLSAFAEIKFDYSLKRNALLSENSAWRFYPVTLTVSIDENNEVKFDTKIQIAYSSTCPCSAALSRQLIQEEFVKAFANKDLSMKDIYDWLGKEESQVATPHSQRSYADIALTHFNRIENIPELYELIDNLEKTISTPVQAAVKREDEQEFARLNGANFMFSEDAARRFKNYCSSLDYLSDFTVKVQHIESLHPHNAVAFASKDK